MTTESTHHTRFGWAPLLVALGAGGAAVLVLIVLAALTDDRAAVVGAAAGGGLTLLVFAFGTSLVGAVAQVMPSASLLVALLTYALQLLVLAVTITAIDRAGVDAATLSRGWFAAGVIAVTLLWVAGQLVAAVRQRIPAFETSETSVAGQQPVPHPGGER